jgi:hypothetical protein
MKEWLRMEIIREINKEDAQTVLKLIRLIDNMSLSNYEKNWREIHKKAGISAQYKLKLDDYSLRVNGDSKRNLYAYETRGKKRKKDKFRWATLKYKNYAYKITYNNEIGKYNARSMYNLGRDMKIIEEE